MQGDIWKIERGRSRCKRNGMLVDLLVVIF